MTVRWISRLGRLIGRRKPIWLNFISDDYVSSKVKFGLYKLGFKFWNVCETGNYGWNFGLFWWFSADWSVKFSRGILVSHGLRSWGWSLAHWSIKSGCLGGVIFSVGFLLSLLLHRVLWLGESRALSRARERSLGERLKTVRGRHPTKRPAKITAQNIPPLMFPFDKQENDSRKFLI